jgi:hypothetical protein
MDNVLPPEIARQVDDLRARGTPEHRIDLFTTHAVAGRWARATRALWRPMCEARKKTGQLCRASPRFHGRCVRHGGGSELKGPRTEEGRRRCADAKRAWWAARKAVEPSRSDREQDGSTATG